MEVEKQGGQQDGVGGQALATAGGRAVVVEGVGGVPAGEDDAGGAAGGNATG